MQQFRSMRSLQISATVHSSVCNHFNQECHLNSRDNFKISSAAALANSAVFARHKGQPRCLCRDWFALI